jgi:uncharacterized protein YdhG (YjbR/CyaY superfamily)
MSKRARTPQDIDSYIAGFPKEVRKVLQAIRATIRKAAPRAEESITYQIPTFKLDGRALVYFAGFESHVSVYPAPVGDPAFKGNLAPYASGKGTARFPLGTRVPLGLIREIVKFRAKKTAR